MLHLRVSRSQRSRKRVKRTKPKTRRLRRRTFAVLGIALIAGSVFVAVGFLSNSSLIPSTPIEVMPTVVVVIIPKGASLNLHLGFEPPMITIVIGVNNTVIWKNEDTDWHTAHSNIPEFNSGLIQPGGNFTHTFLRAGTYPYHCDPHPWMTGIVIVKTATSTSIIAYWPYEQGKPPQSLSIAQIRPRVLACHLVDLSSFPMANVPCNSRICLIDSSELRPTDFSNMPSSVDLFLA